MRFARLAPLTAALFALASVGMTACSDTPADERNPIFFTATHPFSDVVANPKAVHPPITVKVAHGAHFAFVLDSVGPVDLPVTDPRVRCMIVQDTATAYDANGRPLDNSIVRWSVSDSTVVAIDGAGVITPQRCYLDSLGRTDTTTRYVTVSAFVPGARSR